MICISFKNKVIIPSYLTNGIFEKEDSIYVILNKIDFQNGKIIILTRIEDLEFTLNHIPITSTDFFTDIEIKPSIINVITPYNKIEVQKVVNSKND